MADGVPPRLHPTMPQCIGLNNFIYWTQKGSPALQTWFLILFCLFLLLLSDFQFPKLNSWQPIVIKLLTDVFSHISHQVTQPSDILKLSFQLITEKNLFICNRQMAPLLPQLLGYHFCARPFRVFSTFVLEFQQKQSILWTRCMVIL